MTKSRIQRWQIPNKPSVCHLTDCPYKQDGMCDNPRINKGNGDATCHKMDNKVLLAFVVCRNYETN